MPLMNLFRQDNLLRQQENCLDRPTLTEEIGEIPPKQATRSRTGCTECKRRHQKCDEVRPSCGYCKSAGQSCLYQQSIRWGGRPFNKSRFGRVALAEEAGIVKYASESRATALDSTLPTGFVNEGVQSRRPSSDFVYGLQRTTFQKRHSSNSITYLEWLPDLKSSDRALLHHFVYITCPRFAMHEIMTRNILTTLMPMILANDLERPLLPAILYTAAVNQQQLSVSNDPVRILSLKSACIRQLRQRWSRFGQAADDQCIATSLVLCMSEILGESDEPSSWRLHLTGVSNMASRIDISERRGQQFSPFSTRNVLRRWWKSLSAYAESTSHVTQPDTNTSQKWLAPEEDFICAFDGFSTQLGTVLQDIGALLRQKHSILALRSEDNLRTDEATEHLVVILQERAWVQVYRLKAILKRPATRLDPWLEAEGVSQSNTTCFETMSLIFHHVALLEVYQILLSKSTSDDCVVETTEQVIHYLKQLQSHTNPSPRRIATLYPIFVVGCNVHEPGHRSFVLECLIALENSQVNCNVSEARKFLLDLWSRRDAVTDDTFLSWDEFQIERGCDLLLY